MIRDPSVYVLIPVHNRKNVTLSCLESLKNNGDLDRFSIVIIDDESTDGTADAIRTSYPSVKILAEDGNLWWTGAIKKGMEYAYRKGAKYFVWLNDDTQPLPTTITQLVEYCKANPKAIATAQCYRSDQLLQPTYGGQIKYPLSIQLIATPQGQQRDCDCMSGNLVCLPRSVVNDIGYPPVEKLPHCRADIVYTLTGKRAGYNLQVLGDAIGLASLNPLDEGWAFSSVPMIQRWKQLFTLKSNIHPPTYWAYCNQVFGLVGPALFIWVYIKLISFTLARWVLPLHWLTKLKSLKDAKLQPQNQR
jgi:GT2 family glycosyltransferase